MEPTSTIFGNLSTWGKKKHRLLSVTFKYWPGGEEIKIVIIFMAHYTYNVLLVCFVLSIYLSVYLPIYLSIFFLRQDLAMQLILVWNIVLLPQFPQCWDYWCILQCPLYS